MDKPPSHRNYLYYTDFAGDCQYPSKKIEMMPMTIEGAIGNEDGWDEDIIYSNHNTMPVRMDSVVNRLGISKALLTLCFMDD